MQWVIVAACTLIPIAGCGNLSSDPAPTGGGSAAEGQVMKIRFERSGGFAGRTTNVEIDAGELPEAERQALTSLVAASGFFALPPGPDEAPPTGADRFNYRITVETESGTHTIETSEETAPESLAPLLDWLNDASRRRPAGSALR